MESNQIITENIFEQGFRLCFSLNYEEKPSTQKYKDCDRLVVHHDTKTIWFTNQEDLKHTENI